MYAPDDDGEGKRRERSGASELKIDPLIHGHCNIRRARGNAPVAPLKITVATGLDPTIALRFGDYCLRVALSPKNDLKFAI